MTADMKFSCRDMQKFLQQLQTLLSQKRKTFSGHFIAFLKCAWTSRHFREKGWVSFPTYFRNYCFRKRLLLKRLEGLASEHHSVINLLTGSKYRWKMRGTTIIHFSHEFQVNWVRKRFLFSDLKSWDCLLTHWLPMPSIPVAMCRIFCNNFKRYYLKNGRLFPDLWLHFWNVHEI